MIVDAAGQPVELGGIATDITDLKKAEEKLEAEEDMVTYLRVNHSASGEERWRRRAEQVAETGRFIGNCRHEFSHKEQPDRLET
jgi:hypothetical protein